MDPQGPPPPPPPPGPPPPPQAPPPPAPPPSPAVPSAAPRPAPPEPRQRRWLPAIAVLGVIVVVVLGGYVAAAATRPAAGPPIEVVPGITVTPVAGWEEGGRFDEPIQGVRITAGNASLDVFAAPFDGPPVALYETYAESFLAPEASQLQVSQRVEEVAVGGLPGVRGGYIGVFGERTTPIEGELTALVTPDGVGVVFDGWAAEGMLRFVLDEIHEMVASTEVAG